jgi:hypothetical protein
MAYNRIEILFYKIKLLKGRKRLINISIKVIKRLNRRSNIQMHFRVIRDRISTRFAKIFAQFIITINILIM